MKQTIILLALLATSCAKKTSTFESTSTRDSTATVTLPTRSTSIIAQPCDSNGMPRKWEISQSVGRGMITVKSDEKGISVMAESPGDTATNVNKSQSKKEVITKIVTKYPDLFWVLVVINAVQIAWYLLRKRFYAFLNNQR